jgi:hypothetical protein
MLHHPRGQITDFQESMSSSSAHRPLRSSEKHHSPNFALTAFYEVPGLVVLRSSPLSDSPK